MSKSLPPVVDLTSLQERISLAAEIRALSGQLNNFGPIRDQLLAFDKDPISEYREILARRDQLRKTLKALPSLETSQGENVARIDPLLSPITPARFGSGLEGPWFGYSGTVQIGQATEQGNYIAPGTTGSITTLSLDENGSIFFTGDLEATPNAVPKNPGTFNPKAVQFWAHYWTYTIPFPPPTTDSQFTYSFGVAAQAENFGWEYPITMTAPISVFETAAFGVDTLQFGTTKTVFATAFTGDGTENATFIVADTAWITRSFTVKAGQQPLVLLVVGVTASLRNNGTLLLDDQMDCYIVPGNGGLPGPRNGMVDFSYAPLEAQIL